MTGRKDIWQNKLYALRLIKTAVEQGTISCNEKKVLTVTRETEITSVTGSKITWKQNEPLPFAKEIKDAGFSEKIGAKSGTEAAIISITQLLTPASAPSQMASPT
jgi:hypothetical protein